MDLLLFGNRCKVIWFQQIHFLVIQAGAASLVLKVHHNSSLNDRINILTYFRLLRWLHPGLFIPFFRSEFFFHITVLKPKTKFVDPLLVIVTSVQFNPSGAQTRIFRNIYINTIDANTLASSATGSATAMGFNSLGPSDAIWWQKLGSTLAQVEVCCLTAPSHYLNQCWLIISKVEWHSSKGEFTRDTSAINHWNYLEN